MWFSTLATSYKHISIIQLHKLAAEMLFALVMPPHCSAVAVMTDKGHVQTGLNWNKNCFLDHRRVGDILPLVALFFSTAIGKRKQVGKKYSQLKTALLIISRTSSWEDTW